MFANTYGYVFNLFSTKGMVRGDGGHKSHLVGVVILVLDGGLWLLLTGFHLHYPLPLPPLYPYFFPFF